MAKSITWAESTRAAFRLQKNKQDVKTAAVKTWQSINKDESPASGDCLCVPDFRQSMTAKDFNQVLKIKAESQHFVLTFII